MLKKLLELIPDPINENDLCHEVEVAMPLKNHHWRQHLKIIGTVQKVMVT